ncbi:MAG: fused MFS/spermidine synthase [Phycisphaerales bacterium]|nr:MAG: fused MFS/spermidine synthase [Phycisphaerales bacterium]
MRYTPKALVYALFFLSGATGLVYELVWTRELIFVFGGTTYAITTVVVAFMAGLGLGSYLGGKLSSRLQQPGRVYGLIEILIGLYALLVPFLLGIAEPLYRAMYPHVGDHPWVLTLARFCVGALVMIIPTTLMGATLPILVRHVTLAGLTLGRSVGLLYGINTSGAAIGTVLAGFLLIPSLGLTHATWAAAAVNVLIGLTAVVALRTVAESPTRRVRAEPALSRRPAFEKTVAGPQVRAAVLCAFALSGFAAMVYQIAWTRALVMSLGSSTYSFTCILSAFILGLGLGSLIIARWVDRWPNPVRIFGMLELAIGLTAVLIIPIHGQVPHIVERIVAVQHQNYSVLLALEFLLIIAITFVPTFLLGAVFPLVTRTVARRRDDAGAATGRAYAVNTVGTILGSFLAGFALIRSDVLGIQNSIVAAALLNCFMGGWMLILSRSSRDSLARTILAAGIPVILVPIVSTVTGEWNRKDLISAPFVLPTERDTHRQSELEYFADGVDLTVAVTRLTGIPDYYSISVNGKVDASTDLLDMTTMLLLGHIPATLDDGGKDACILGLGSGLTVAALARHSDYRTIDCLEISDEVIKGASYFAPYCYHVLRDDPRVRVIRADGRNHLLLTERTYDVIISGPSNPWLAGISNLFTREFFQICKDRLGPGGVFCSWLHGYSMSLQDFRMVARTLTDVFAHVSIWELSKDDYLFVAGDRPPAVPLNHVLERLSLASVRQDLYRIGLGTPAKVLGRLIVSGNVLREWAATAPVHTDDNALLEFSAPRQLYAQENTEIARALFARQRSPFEQDLVPAPENPAHQALQEETADVSRARKLRLVALEHQKQGRYARALDALLQAYRLDPGDPQVYYLLLDIRRQLEAQAPDAARSLALQPQLEAIDELPVPTVAAPKGYTLLQISQMLQTQATAAGRRQQWSLAAGYLSEAFDLEPDSGVVARRLGFALTKSGRPNDAAGLLDTFLYHHPTESAVSYLRAELAVQMGDFDTALTRLETVLRSGRITVGRLNADKALDPLRSDPRFQALLELYTDASNTAPGEP